MSHIHNMVLVAVRYNPLYTNCVLGHSHKHQLFHHYGNKNQIHFQTYHLFNVVLLVQPPHTDYDTSLKLFRQGIFGQ